MYIGSASIGTGGLTYLSKGENPRETEPMYIKHSVSLIGTGGLTYLSKGENPSEAEPMFNDSLCLMYKVSVSCQFPPLAGTPSRLFLSMIHCI
jgi:hypothetical protein